MEDRGDKITFGLDPAKGEQDMTAIIQIEMNKLGEQMAHMYNKQLLKRFIERKCTYCGIGEFKHAITYNGYLNHPFFNNNLEYLEWASEQHTNRNAR